MDLFDIVDMMRDRRKSLGMTQAQLAAKSGLSRVRISQLESGNIFDMQFGNALGVLNALGLDLRITDYNSGRPTLDDLLAEREKEHSLNR
ncbi:MAG: helix-turn-helix domain-containing protein [Pelagimonas sp.]